MTRLATTPPLALLQLALALLLTIGCTTTGSLLGARGSSKTATAQPWEIAEGTYPSQRLYRIRYQGPEGQLSFKLILYLEAREQFRMRAADTLGRKLWVLQVDQRNRALWLNHRERTYCWADRASGLSLIPLSRLPLLSLPRLLLGRLPVAPAADLRQEADQLSFLDARGRTWASTLEAGEPERWSLIEDGEPSVWWQREDDGKRPGAIFSDRRGQQQVRWTEIVSEPLESAVTPEIVPEGYREESCALAGR